MDDAELEAKFRNMFAEYGNQQQCAATLNGLWNLDHAADIGDVLKLFVIGHERASASGVPEQAYV
jgi:hypothetical protein